MQQLFVHSCSTTEPYAAGSLSSYQPTAKQASYSQEHWLLIEWWPTIYRGVLTHQALLLEPSVCEASFLRLRCWCSYQPTAKQASYLKVCCLYSTVWLHLTNICLVVPKGVLKHDKHSTNAVLQVVQLQSLTFLYTSSLVTARSSVAI